MKRKHFLRLLFKLPQFSVVKKRREILDIHGNMGRVWEKVESETYHHQHERVPGVGWPSIQRAFFLLLKSVRNRKRFFLSLSELSASISWLFCFLILLPARQSELSWRVVGTRMNKTCVLGIVGRVRVCGPPIRSFVVHIRLYVHFGDVIVCKFA
jgi:hypothetical protein